MTVDRTYIEVFNNQFEVDACDYLINLFNKDERQQQGTIFDDHLEKPLYLDEHKKSTDLYLDFTSDKDKEYNDIILHRVTNSLLDYKQKYTFLNCIHPWLLAANYNIQHYTDGEGYFDLHCEHGVPDNVNKRMLAWMVYLNDAKCGTEFPEHNYIANAKAGNMVIWPSFWTHPHKGVTPNIGDKYIITGWCIFDSTIK